MGLCSSKAAGGEVVVAVRRARIALGAAGAVQHRRRRRTACDTAACCRPIPCPPLPPLQAAVSAELTKGAAAPQKAPSDNGSSLKSSKPADSVAAEPVRGAAASLASCSSAAPAFCRS